MRWNVLFGAQAALLALGLYATTLWPASGKPAVLVLVTSSAGAGWHWLSKENAKVLGVDSVSQQVTVIVPSQASLLRALAKGMLPISTKGNSCAVPLEQAGGTSAR